MKYPSIPSSLFKKRRAQFTKHMTPGAIAIFLSNDEMPRNGDQTFPFRQNSDTFLLSGLDQEDSILVLFPDAPKEEWKELAFIKKTNKEIAIWEGHKFTLREAQEISGVQHIHWTDSFDNLLRQLLQYTSSIYINQNEQPKFSTPVRSKSMRFADFVQSNYPLHQLLRAQPILRRMRTVKLQEEIDLIRQACSITRDTFYDILSFVKPGVWEYEIEAKILHGFISRRANGYAYYPIVASGANANVLHYVANNDQCSDGELILMDFGAEYANYAADTTRCIPVNGHFSPRQKQVYKAVQHVLNKATQLLKPGVLLDEYEKEVGKLMEQQLIHLGLITREDIANQNPQSPAYKKYYMHGTSHHMGLDVHDVNDRHTPLQDGVIVTCEPAIYIPEEGLGIRLENDILISGNHPINLMSDIPIEIEEIEELMNSGQ